MTPEIVSGVLARLDGIGSEVTSLRRTVDAEPMQVSDRQYVSRCFDLLEMELGALRQYLHGLLG
jgi:hypothetical protein